MEHVVLTVHSLKQLQHELQPFSAWQHGASSGKLLAQIYSKDQREGWLKSVAQQLRESLPNVTVIGCSAMGVVCAERFLSNSTVISIMRFDQSYFHATIFEGLKHEEYHQARRLTSALCAQYDDLQGVLLLSNPTQIDTEQILKGITDELPHTPIFGGLAGDFSHQLATEVIFNGDCTDAGVVVVAFFGKDLRIQTFNYLGWIPFGEPMTITSGGGNQINTINNIAAYDLYHYFIGVEKEEFFEAAMEFPLMVSRGGKTIARVPVRVGDDNQLLFLAQLEKGDSVRFGYGDVSTILSDLSYSKEELESFNPEAVLVFSCCVRQAFLQEDKKAEILPYRDLAPVAGFFTFGEIDTANVPNHILNATIVSVAFSEAPARRDMTNFSSPSELVKITMSRNLNRLQRLMCFISRMTDKLNANNQQLARLAQLDSLTQVFNRRAFEEHLLEEIQHSQVVQAPMSLMMIDIDHFKQVNDKYGHTKGDSVILQVVDIVNHCIRGNDIFARYGGEEFILLLPQTDYDEALHIAERIRSCIAAASSQVKYRHSDLPSVTCSIGVASLCHEHDSADAIINRADKALYSAKDAGRDCVKGEA